MSQERKIAIVGGNEVVRGAAAVAAGAVLVGPDGAPVTTGTATSREDLRRELDAKLAELDAARERIAGPLQPFGFQHGRRKADGSREYEGVYLKPDPVHKTTDKAGRVDYVFDGQRLMRARPKAPGGKKARIAARRKAAARGCPSGALTAVR